MVGENLVITPSDPRPLPPQPLGVLPTGEFWQLASVTPIALPLWTGLFLFASLIQSCGLAWWQHGLGSLAFILLWSGLIERRARVFLATRRSTSETPVRSRGRSARLFADAEFWRFAMKSLFGRFAGAFQAMLTVALCLAISYPAWQMRVGAVALMFSLSLGLGAWQRRLIHTRLLAGKEHPASAIVREGTEAALSVGDTAAPSPAAAGFVSRADVEPEQ